MVLYSEGIQTRGPNIMIFVSCVKVLVTMIRQSKNIKGISIGETE